MNKKLMSMLVAGVMIISIGASGYAVMITDRSNDILRQQIQTSQKQTVEIQKKYNTTSNDLTKVKAMLEKVDAESEKIENEREILKQQLENEKMLRTAAEKKARSLVSLSRGSIVDGGVFGTGSRIDVKTGISARQLNKAFEGTRMAGTGSAFVEAEKETGVNAIFLASIAALESGWGSSPNARNKNNLFGFGSYDYDSSQTVVFSSKTQGVVKVARALRRDYLNTNGAYFHGATPSGVNVKYCTSSNWKNQVTTIMNMIVNRVT